MRAGSRFFSDPFFAAFARGIGAAAAEVDKNLVLMVMSGDEERERALAISGPST